MKKTMIVVALSVTLLAIGEHWDVEGSFAAQDVGYRVEALWTMEGSHGRGYSLIDPAALSIPDNLVGTLIDSIGNLYLCDVLTEEMCMLDCQGDLVYCAGSVGGGPEDHRGLGEPVVWSGGRIARADCAVSSKLIVYSPRGNYEDSVDLVGFSQFNRLFTSPVNIVGVGMDMNGSPRQGMHIQVYLGLIDSNGEVTKSLQASTKELPSNQAGVQLKEEDFWLMPRVAVGADGRVFVQSDLYSNALTCYSADLERLWTFEGEWPAEERSDAELEEAKLTLGTIKPARQNQSLVRIVPRSNGEVWVEAAASGSGWQNPEVIFDVIDSQGTFDGTASLAGLPAYPGHFKIFDSFLVWMIDPDFEDDGGTVPSLGVFRIVKTGA